jgi:hypothetical protein
VTAADGKRHAGIADMSGSNRKLILKRKGAVRDQMICKIGTRRKEPKTGHERSEKRELGKSDREKESAAPTRVSDRCLRCPFVLRCFRNDHHSIISSSEGGPDISTPSLK